ncbi:hypothetical protein [Streptomyces sp. URMC 126]|uniref:hypothetical protein n=1 Tax=Streptomyces sp. URMC 126 TaxID=3423401 RepID=UPI003F5325A1
MRYLVEPFMVGALGRGRSIERFLGPVGSPDRPGVRYAEVRAARTSFEVWVHIVEDVGGATFLDLGEFRRSIRTPRKRNSAGFSARPRTR